MNKQKHVAQVHPKDCSVQKCKQEFAKLESQPKSRRQGKCLLDVLGRCVLLVMSKVLSHIHLVTLCLTKKSPRLQIDLFLCVQK